MLHTDAKSLRDRGDRLFAVKLPIDRKNQDIAENFYLERADFTVTRQVGEVYADHLSTGYPVMVRRDLGNSFGSMLRPKGQEWFHVRADREDQEDHEAKVWLEWASGLQRRAMYDRKSMFTRATKEGDHDFASFGNCVISTDVNRRDMALLYRCWHLRDMAWAEDSYGFKCEFHRKWMPSAMELCSFFPGKVHAKVTELKDKDPHAKVNVRHVIIKGDEYGGAKFRQPWVSMYIDCDNDHILEEIGSWTEIYTIPSWVTVSGSQYAYSPATTIALPDARLLQAMTSTLLEAGERTVNPPMVGVSEAIRGDMQLYPGGFTSVDAEYDERLGAVLRPLTTDKSGLQFGIEMSDRTMGMLREAFYLNTLSMPPAGNGDMTAYEVGQRVQEYIRNALPLFEPMEADYNGALCEMTFETLLRNGAFGPAESIPESIRGRDIKFEFESPLATMVERQKGQKFLEAKALIADAAAIDPAAVQIMDFSVTLRDVLSGIGAPEKWLRSPEAVAEAAEAKDVQDQMSGVLASMQQGADVAATLGTAAQSFEGVQ